MEGRHLGIGGSVSRRNWIQAGARILGTSWLLNQLPATCAAEEDVGSSTSLPSPNFPQPLNTQLASMKGSSDPLVAKKYMILHDQALHHYETLKLTATNDLRALSKPSDFTLKPGVQPAYFETPYKKLPIKPIENLSKFYDYEPDPDPSVTAFWTDFANLQLGGGVFGHGFVQEEIMCCEVPELANASALSTPLHTRYPGREVLAGSPEPLVLMGVHRVMEFYSDRPGHPYGTEDFKELNIARPQDYIRLLNPGLQFNVLAMAAPHLADRTPQQQFAIDTIRDLFNTFVAGFTLASAAAKSEGRHATVNTGKIGSGDFNNNATVVYVLQGMAAEFLGVNLRFWGYADWEVELARRYYEAIRQKFILGQTTVAAVLDLAQKTFSSALVEDVEIVGGNLKANVYGDPGASYQLQTSPDLKVWTPGAMVKLDRVPTAVSIPVSSGDPLFLRANSF